MTNVDDLFIIEDGDRKLDVPDLQKAQVDRVTRDLIAMEEVNPVVAHTIINTESGRSEEHLAATIIQSYVRRFLAGKRYVSLLYDKYRQELAAQDALQREQLEEAEILLDSYRLTTEIEEAQTAHRNLDRIKEDHVIVIQRAWRQYKRRCWMETQKIPESNSIGRMRVQSSQSTDVESTADTPDIELFIQDTPTIDRTNPFKNFTASPTPQADPPASSAHRPNPFTDLVASSATTDSMKPSDASKPTTTDQSSYSREETPTPNNSLSNDQANQLGCTDDPSTSSARINPFFTTDIDGEVETTLPQLDWASLEQKLLDSAQEQKRLTQTTDRDDVRRRLAAGCSDVTEEEQTPADDLRRPGLGQRLQSNSALQLCFMNEAVNSDGEDTSPTLVNRLNPGVQSDETTEAGVISVDDVPAEDLLTKQALLQADAQQKLAKAQRHAHEQLEQEKREQEGRPADSIVKAEGVQGAERLQRRKQHDMTNLVQLNTAQLQLLLNDMLNQIQGFNMELVELLMERDDLHMAQDSMLVDIADLSQRAHEIAVKVKEGGITVQGLTQSFGPHR